MEHFYRFRSIDALLGERRELEQQEIYFCPPQDLNDPTEGFKDLFWRGDAIVWRRLLEHYLLCLMRCVSIAILAGPEDGPVPSKGIIVGSRDSLPTEQFKAVHKQLCERFFASSDIAKIPSILAAYPYPLRRNGLVFCLRGIHGNAVKCVFDQFRSMNILPDVVTTPVSDEVAARLVDAMTNALKHLTINDEHLDPATFEVAFFVGDLLHQQSELMSYINAVDETARGWLSISALFPETYVQQLDNLVYTDWYAACFVADPTHAAMWGHYGDSHRGICLKFKSHKNRDGRPVIQLHGLTGGQVGPHGSGPTFGDRELPFSEMRYAAKFIEVDFFRSIGVLPVPTLRREWFSDDDGNASVCSEELFSDEDEWRRKYWEAFGTITTAKFKDWQYEGEHRLILVSALDLFTEANDRKLKYHFSDLDGLIFGMRTSLSDKRRIIEIIDAKCTAEGRKDFEFSQAAYDPATGSFVPHPLKALRFE